MDRIMIRRFLAAGLLVWLVIAPALEIRAQILPMILFKKAASAPAGYTGPGDAVSGATAFWSCSRAYSAATRGTKACNICNSTGGVDVLCVDVSSDATTGIVADPTIGGVLCTTNCTIKTAYDQTGNGHDATNVTIANRPTLTVASLGSALVYATFTGSSSQFLVTALNIALPQPFTYVYEANSQVAAVNPVLATASVSRFLYSGGFSGTQFRMFAGTNFSFNATENAWHSIQAIFNNTSSIGVTDGTPTSGSAGTAAGTSSDGICIGGSFSTTCNGGNFYTGLFAEGAAYAGAFNSTQYGAMSTNQATFY